MSTCQSVQIGLGNINPELEFHAGGTAEIMIVGTYGTGGMVGTYGIIGISGIKNKIFLIAGAIVILFIPVVPVFFF